MIKRALIVIASSLHDLGILIQRSFQIVLPAELFCQILLGVGLQAEFKAFLSLCFLSSAIREID